MTCVCDADPDFPVVIDSVPVSKDEFCSTMEVAAQGPIKGLAPLEVNSPSPPQAHSGQQPQPAAEKQRGREALSGIEAMRGNERH